MIAVLLIGAGGFLGAICRYIVSQRLSRIYGRFPFGTLTVNLLGSFLLGWMIGGEWLKSRILLWGTGFMGAFTTFSTFKLESVNMWTNKEYGKMGLYLGMSYTAGIILAFAGYSLAMIATMR